MTSDKRSSWLHLLVRLIFRMKRYDPIEYHTNGAGWSWAHDSVMRECEEGQWVRREDVERDLAKMRAAMDAVSNARTLDEAKWAANSAIAATTPIQFPSA